MTIELETIKKGFSIGELVKFGWTTFKDNIGFFIGVLLLMIAIPAIPAALAEYMGQETHPVAYVILEVLSYLLGLLMTVGLINITLKFSKNETPTFADLFNIYPVIGNYFIAYILYALIVLAGLVLFIIPGVIWALRYGLYAYFVVDKGAGPIEALKLSAKATYGAKWDLLSLIIVGSLITLLGVLGLILGLFVAIPVVMLAGALAYRKLVAQTPDL